MPIPLNDLKRTYSSNAAAFEEAVLATMRSGWWLNGGRAHDFCNAFASYVGVKHCVGVANGTDALEIAMRALVATRCAGRGEAITVPNAGGYSAIAMHQLHLTPVYADIDPTSQLASQTSILSALTPQTAFVVITHLYGNVFDVPSLRKEMDALGFPHVAIMEDCSQAHGAKLGDRMVGSFGDVATFSFYPTKNLGAFGDAGAIVTRDDALAEDCEALRQYGWRSKYEIARPNGRNSRLDEIQAAILSVQLPHLDHANQRRVAILDRYEAAVPSSIRIARGPKGSVAHLAVLLCDDRDGLRDHLNQIGVATDIHYPILDCDQAGWRDHLMKEAPGGLANARNSVIRLLTVPCFPTMREEEIDAVCQGLASWKA
ncbi:DegT/DnrJ/EryC1/StrS family aminotransferase [Aureimonas frigidaquae]|uniref:DegT/DnrJ/EryC1/StrS family aminotransferase n=1 Tax=Aureimonas frigidaquae TaxID=424757 RepID=UPI0009FB1CA2|nr:DegT/DnrJ/EryC1/StrS family aminotransferase [Aureimonas frigidaquae]